MNLNTYQDAAKQFASYPKQVAHEYVLFGLLSEAGEIAGKVKKGLRGDHITTGTNVALYNNETFRTALVYELGDCLWYLAMICEEFGLDLNDVAVANLAKLLKRQQNGTIKGDGDYR
jgi:NTP pyrophosphatase (non-canonical NTP hydrolase)